MPKEFYRLLDKLEKAQLEKLTKIIQVEFYDNDEYFVARDERIDFMELDSSKTPYIEHKKILIDEIKEQICRNNKHENFVKVCCDIDRIYFAVEVLEDLVMTEAQLEREKWVKDHNNSLPQETWYDSDGEVGGTFGIYGIYDSEYMNYVFDNIESRRIKAIKHSKK